MKMDKIPPKRRGNKAYTTEELSQLDKNELIDKVLQLQAHTVQLRNIISKQGDCHDSLENFSKQKEFNFSKCHFRKVLLKFLYFGWDYQGLAVQENSNQTIENYLFTALKRACLIESRETSQYHRCGRTDKGVSAFGQVISISLRSKFPVEDQDKEESIRNELPYCKMLNRLLPKDIRMVCWMGIPLDKPEYSARFDCKKRLYKYYFPKSNLNIEAMRESCRHLLGSHDFRNLCKMDVGNGVTAFIRNVIRAEIVCLDPTSDDPTSMYALLIEGNAFLWHQIRCIFGVIALVGQGREEPGVVRELLDVESNPRKPQYSMALDVPLNLYHCSYELETYRHWHYDKEELEVVIGCLQSYWTLHSVKSTMIKDCANSLQEIYLREKRTEDGGDGACEGDGIMSHSDCLLQGVKPRDYKPLLKRDKCTSLEEKIEYYKKRRKNQNEKTSMETQ